MAQNNEGGRKYVQENRIDDTSWLAGSTLCMLPLFSHNAGPIDLGNKKIAPRIISIGLPKVRATWTRREIFRLRFCVPP